MIPTVTCFMKNAKLQKIKGNRKGQRSIVILRNYNESEVQLSLPTPMEDMGTGEVCQDMTLAAYVVRFLYKD